MGRRVGASASSGAPDAPSPLTPPADRTHRDLDLNGPEFRGATPAFAATHATQLKLALDSELPDQAAWVLNTLAVSSCDPSACLAFQQCAGLLDALARSISRHLRTICATPIVATTAAFASASAGAQAKAQAPMQPNGKRKRDDGVSPAAAAAAATTSALAPSSSSSSWWWDLEPELFEEESEHEHAHQTVGAAVTVLRNAASASSTNCFCIARSQAAVAALAECMLALATFADQPRRDGDTPAIPPAILEAGEASLDVVLRGSSAIAENSLHGAWRGFHHANVDDKGKPRLCVEGRALLNGICGLVRQRRLGLVQVSAIAALAGLAATQVGLDFMASFAGEGGSIQQLQAQAPPGTRVISLVAALADSLACGSGVQYMSASSAQVASMQEMEVTHAATYILCRLLNLPSNLRPSALVQAELARRHAAHSFVHRLIRLAQVTHKPAQQGGRSWTEACGQISVSTLTTLSVDEHWRAVLKHQEHLLIGAALSCRADISRQLADALRNMERPPGAPPPPSSRPPPSRPPPPGGKPGIPPPPPPKRGRPLKSPLKEK